ncbi:hypothetical protein RUM44_002776 [Polyplax serrata]|uniref:Uncharacterized protein n=1 Tax=Polyplax serrata TaxID=468196 RepID=A0ABR1AFP8_POLSC
MINDVTDSRERHNKKEDNSRTQVLWGAEIWIREIRNLKKAEGATEEFTPCRGSRECPNLKHVGKWQCLTLNLTLSILFLDGTPIYLESKPITGSFKIRTESNYPSLCPLLCAWKEVRVNSRLKTMRLIEMKMGLGLTVTFTTLYKILKISLFHFVFESDDISPKKQSSLSGETKYVVNTAEDWIPQLIEVSQSYRPSTKEKKLAKSRDTEKGRVAVGHRRVDN